MLLCANKWNQTLLVLTISSLTRQEQFDVDCYTDSRFSIGDSFVAGAYDASYRGAKDPFKPRTLNAGSSVELSSRGAPSNWANQVPRSKTGSLCLSKKRNNDDNFGIFPVFQAFQTKPYMQLFISNDSLLIHATHSFL